MADCYKAPRQRGLWYEIKTIEDTIRSKQARGVDFSKEQELLDSFRKYAKDTHYKSRALDKDYHAIPF